MYTSLALFPLLLPIISSASVPQPRGWHGKSSVWAASNFKSFVTFGDSYTDESRLTYFATHNASAPPPGTLLPESNATAGGGYTWPRYVVRYTGATVGGQWQPSMTLYNYAVSGAVCSNEITPRTASPGFNFPSVLEYEVPAFIADKSANRINTTTPYFQPPLSASSAVYSMWIGTNDLGVWAFLTDSQVPGKVLSDYTDCIFQSLDHLYATGARIFVLMNTIPLQLAPLYANDTINGVGANEYWPMKPTNHTAIAEKMHESTTSVNNIFKYQTPYEAMIAKRYPGASFALFDVWQLISDIYDNPKAYLNGTQPANVQGFENHCDLKRMNCVKEYGGKSPDSFLWYDELHPSEQTDRVIARNFIDVLNGKSKYATYYDC